MARSFARASSQYLYQTSPILAAPFTISWWMYPVDGDNKQNPFNILYGSDGSEWHGFYTELEGNISNQLHINAWAGSDAKAQTTTSYSINTWQHVIAVAASSTLRWIMLDGAGYGENTTSSAPDLGTAPNLAIGAYRIPDTSSYDHFDGRMAEVTIWNAALTQAEGIALARGASPLTIRPQSIIRYWPVVRNDQDWVGGSTLTAVNSPTFGDHSPRGHFRAPVLLPAFAAATSEKSFSATASAISATPDTVALAVSRPLSAQLQGVSATPDDVVLSIEELGIPTWVSPADEVTIGKTPTLVFTTPSFTGNAHFELQLDTANTFDTGDLRSLKTSESQTGWEYDNGASWQPFPSGGLPDTYAGNDVRYTAQTALSYETWYRRARMGQDQ